MFVEICLQKIILKVFPCKYKLHNLAVSKFCVNNAILEPLHFSIDIPLLSKLTKMDNTLAQCPFKVAPKT